MERIQSLIQSGKPANSANSVTTPVPAALPAPKAQPGKAAAVKRPTAAPFAPAPAPVYEDSSAIQPGIAYDDLIRRFGPPTVAITENPTTRTLLYSGKDGRVELQVRDGKVISVQPREARQPNVMLPG